MPYLIEYMHSAAPHCFPDCIDSIALLFVLFNWTIYTIFRVSLCIVELALNAALVENKNFSLNFTGNISYNRNKIDELNTGTEWDTNYTLPTVTTGNNFRIVEGGRLGDRKSVV